VWLHPGKQRGGWELRSKWRPVAICCGLQHCVMREGPRMRGGRGLRGWLCRGSRPTSLRFKFAVSGVGSDWPGAIVAGGLWGDCYSV
jgi:hypothetical protein